jgi:hypothetical protein
MRAFWPASQEDLMSTLAHDTAAKSGMRRLALVPLGLGISLLFVISYVLCVALGLIWWGDGLHQPWLQFLPGFTWLSWGTFFLGLMESFVYGWYIALVFTPLFNFFSARFG